ncbi:MAG: hypothetical protein AB7P02_28505, partial [Alphaproteobacteria bacterium]
MDGAVMPVGSESYAGAAFRGKSPAARPGRPALDLCLGTGGRDRRPAAAPGAGPKMLDFPGREIIDCSARSGFVARRLGPVESPAPHAATQREDIMAEGPVRILEIPEDKLTAEQKKVFDD